MVTSKQIKEKVRDYRRAFKHNWNLFKQNKVGLFGLGIMIAFILMALLSPTVLNMTGYRDPIEWMAPDSDVVVVDNYINKNTSTPVINDLVFRIHPTGGTTTPVDRIYYAAGDGSLRFPYGIYSKSIDDGNNAWQMGTFSKAFPTNSPVTTKPVGVDFGNSKRSESFDFRLFFGTENGRVYVVEDGLDNIMVPSGDSVWTAQLNGQIEGVAVHNEKYGKILNESDMFFATTSEGGLYAYRGLTNTSSNEFLGWQEMWRNETVTNVSLTRPAVDGEGQYVYVGSRDGKLYGFNAADGSFIDEYDLYDPLYDYPVDASQLQIEERTAANLKRSYWSSNPVGMLDKIFAATDDGRVHVLNAGNATPLSGWEGGYQVNLTATTLDLGNFTTPYITEDGGAMLIGSSTGYMFRLSTSPIAGFSPVKQIFDTSLNGAMMTSIEVSPYWDLKYQKYIYIPTRNLAFTPDDPSDDFTVMFAINSKNEKREIDITGEAVSGYIGQGNVTWRKSIQGVTYGQTIVYDDWAGTGDGHLSTAELAFATVILDSDGNPDANATGTKLYSFNAAGRMITPLPPSWAISETTTVNGEEVPNDKWTNKTEGADTPHESGNTYFLGTDSQGRDILTQTLMGSRIALLVGFAAAIFSISIGLLVGLVSGYYGGNVDTILMRFTDVILVLPGLPLLIILAAILNPSIWNIVFIIGIVGWGGTARVIRSEVLTLKERPFIDSARVTGASKARIMFRHIAPNILPLAVLYMTFYVSGAILAEASLAFIGLGDPSTMSWGMMLNYVQYANALGAWWWLLPPGIAITLISLSFFLLGRAFDEIVNPRLRRRQ